MEPYRDSIELNVELNSVEGGFVSVVLNKSPQVDSWYVPGRPYVVFPSNAFSIDVLQIRLWAEPLPAVTFMPPYNEGRVPASPMVVLEFPQRPPLQFQVCAFFFHMFVESICIRTNT